MLYAGSLGIFSGALNIGSHAMVWACSKQIACGPPRGVYPIARYIAGSLVPFLTSSYGRVPSYRLSRNSFGPGHQCGIQFCKLMELSMPMHFVFGVYSMGLAHKLLLPFQMTRLDLPALLLVLCLAILLHPFPSNTSRAPSVPLHRA